MGSSTNDVTILGKGRDLRFGGESIRALVIKSVIGEEGVQKLRDVTYERPLKRIMILACQKQTRDMK